MIFILVVDLSQDSAYVRKRWSVFKPSAPAFYVAVCLLPLNLFVTNRSVPKWQDSLGVDQAFHGLNLDHYLAILAQHLNKLTTSQA